MCSIGSMRVAWLRCMCLAVGVSTGGLTWASEPVSALDDPANASTPVPPVRYQWGPLLPTARELGLNRATRLPWRELFAPDGEFVPEPQLSPGVQHVHAENNPSRSSQPSQTANAQSAATGPSAGSDARAVVRAINVEQGKIKLKHGPIPKLDMPGMTMVFRVKDPALLEQVSKGEEVGFTVELDGTTFYVTGFQK